MKKKILDHLELIAKLMDLHNENAFKTKAYKTAIDNIYYQLEDDDDKIQNVVWSNFKGVGNSISTTIAEFLTTGSSTVFKKYIQATPSSILELMLSIRGIGIKKIALLWKEYNIISINQLYETCKQNKLQSLKGFGKSMEEKVAERIEFYFENKGLKLYANAIALADDLCHQLQKYAPQQQHKIIGELRRQLPIIKKIQILTSLDSEGLQAFLIQNDFEIILIEENNIITQHSLFSDVDFILTKVENFGTLLFKNSASQSFLIHFNIPENVKDEASIFTKNACHFIPAYLREDEAIINLYKKEVITLNIIQQKDIKGLIHCHSKWSDGENSIVEIAEACKKAGLEYMVITDHSKTSVIANGLQVERLQKQWNEIDALNQELAPFKIFKGIECDILGDGNLDYDNDILANFDIVIASIHQNLDMTQEQATERVLKAIKNPNTNMLGHSSGRLLLNRKGYDLDYETIFEACVKLKVSIELNSNPFRLDIDWKYLARMKTLGILTSINPDAHSLKAIDDIQFGIAMAQKGAITIEENISSFSVNKMELYIKEQKQKLNL